MQDLLVIGGGINGAGIARDAAGRGLSVTLCEKDDLASHTSSASTKLVHGGLRYLEHYEFRLVREALHEREVLLKSAPHIIWPLRFVLPHDAGLRPKWMLRLGLFLYDRIGGKRTLEGTHTIDLREAPHGMALQSRLTTGFEYSDCWVEDSRLVVLAAMDAREAGADILTRTRCTALARTGDHWRATLQGPSGQVSIVEARAIANAAGPWVDDLVAMATGGTGKAHLRLVKGSHIILPRWYEGEHCYIFQNGDGRIVFAIPYERDFTLVGTTDMLFEGDRDAVQISDDERDYLCAAVSEYFARPVTPADVVHSYAGIRPLYEDNASNNSTVTRDYVFEVDAPDGEAPLLSVYGGKITTFRKLAEHALDRLEPWFDTSGAWTADSPLPGGDLPTDTFSQYLVDLGARFPWLPEATRLRLARAYGSRVERILMGASSLQDLGPPIVGDLTPAEVRYLCEREFARSAQDILWRRSKLGLHLPPDAEQSLSLWLETADFA